MGRFQVETILNLDLFLKNSSNFEFNFDSELILLVLDSIPIEGPHSVSKFGPTRGPECIFKVSPKFFYLIIIFKIRISFDL